MLNNYDTYMDKVLDIKELVYTDFKKSGTLTYREFLKDELEDVEIVRKQPPEE